jgi:peptidoglycan/xylan/chitin deacetylase (PgdA/CDA1 family)
MKHNKQTMWERIRHGFAVFIACAVVLGVPGLTIVQLGHFHFGNSRRATALPAFQARAVDETTQPMRIFKEPLISVTFDDGYEDIYKSAMPLLQKRGIHSTQYVLSGVENNRLYLSWDQIKAMQKAGQEIGCHTVNHPDLTTITHQQVMYQLHSCQQTMQQKLDASVTDFASPYGAYNAAVLADTKQVFASHRNVNGDPTNGVSAADVNVARYFDPNDIIGVTVNKHTTIAQLQALVQFAVQNNGWVVLVYHQADDGPSKYALDPAKLDQQMTYLQHTPVRIVTVQQAVASWKAEQINTTKAGTASK